ncbi:MAG TPA: hypothetical protein DCK95_08645 [Anaerolineaceae bacterium]|nr:hypothetical protein [Anaerolineaceae bacterium]
MTQSCLQTTHRNSTLSPAKKTTLTRRQYQCLQLTAAGLTANAIAHRLEISERMVRAHLRDARLRLDARSTAEAVYLALKQNLLE